MSDSVDAGAQRLIMGFYLAIDDGRYADAASCFSLDGEWHRKQEVLQGPEKIAAVYEGRAPSHRVRHVITNMTINEVQEGARFTFYVTAYVGEAKGDALPRLTEPPLLLTCDGLLKRTGATWKIRTLRTTRQMQLAV